MDFDQVRRYTPQILKIAQKYGISHVYVFGSIARGESKPGSDLDLLVEMQQGASLFGAAGFGYEAEKLLGVPVDIVPLSVLPRVKDQEFAARIRKEAVQL
jgi:uncharacterized protein